MALQSLRTRGLEPPGHDLPERRRRRRVHRRCRSPWSLIVPVPRPGHAANTATAALRACRAGAVDDFQIASGVCINLTDAAERTECLEEASVEREEARALVRQEQRDARLRPLRSPGRGALRPDFDPADFVDPLEIGGAVAPNPYFPLIPGTRWVYEGGDETITVTVTEEDQADRGRDLPGRRTTWWRRTACRSRTPTTGMLRTSTATSGIAARSRRTSRSSKAMIPKQAELVDIDGSWKAGRDGAQPGIIMLALPQVGDVYRQEAALGEAEDAARVIRTTGSAKVPAASCDGDCVVTRDFTPLEPDANERKFYAPGVGLILERDLVAGDRVEAGRVHRAMNCDQGG